MQSQFQHFPLGCSFFERISIWFKSKIYENLPKKSSTSFHKELCLHIYPQNVLFEFPTMGLFFPFLSEHLVPNGNACCFEKMHLPSHFRTVKKSSTQSLVKYIDIHTHSHTCSVRPLILAHLDMSICIQLNVN